MPILPPTPPTKSPINRWWDSVVQWFDQFLDLREGMDREGAAASIIQGKFMRGSNAWMLVCSIMIASLGLNLNSGAVIIGAMLISPLMNPILGLGLGVATNDREVLSASVRHFFIAITIALITSVLYFLLTPLREFTPEMEARTAPTILDGLVAIFGGLAGIISVTRADKTNAIPGVAIATALMPPLCVSGYGIAVADWDIAAKAFYLFFLNSFFIAAMAYLIIRLLRFPYRKYVNDHEARRSRLLIALFSIIIIIPGFIILRDVLRDSRFDRGLSQFIEKEFNGEITDHRLIPIQKSDSLLLVVELYNWNIYKDSTTKYQHILRSEPYSIEKVKIIAIPDYSLSLDRLDKFQEEQLDSLDNIRSRLENFKVAKIREEAVRKQLHTELTSYRLDSAAFQQFADQLLIAFPSVAEINLSRCQFRNDSIFIDGLPLVALKRTPQRNRTQEKEELQRINAYLKTSLAVDTLQLVVY